MQRSSRGKIAFNCGRVKCNFCQFCINMCIGRSVWSWKLRSLSVWSKRIAWNLKRRWFEAVFVPTDERWTSTAACWQEHRPSIVGETENVNSSHMWWKQDGTHPLDKASRANHEQWNDDWSILLFIPLLCWPNEVLQSAAPAVGPGSICLTSNPRMQVSCFGDVSNTRHMFVTSHKNHSDECLWQPFWQTLAWCQIESAAAQWGARMGSLISVTLAELGPDLWRKGRFQHGLVIRRFDQCAGWNVAALLHQTRCPERWRHVKTMRWCVLAANLEAFVLTWRYPCGTSEIPAMLIAVIAEQV